ncbi:cytoplasmic protein [Pseudescherichia sp.]|uniref:cytoplasmic protein n=1 Tax=Pseudescherichia sp. TaxID=2055881 RepID=UPI002899B95A|nr:cytoplasmic protein [Pseudescherichia sp.]
MFSLFTINTCKTAGCRNLGLASSPDYIWPDYRLGYPALHCRACGSYSPLFNGNAFQRWVSVCLSRYAKEHGHFCPRCYQTAIIHYGHNPKGTQRIQCQHCKKVWTPKKQRLKSAPAPEAICTIPLIVPFQGARANQQLYFLLSFDSVSGNVIHTSSNFTPHQAGLSLHYRWQGTLCAQPEYKDIIQRVSLRERQFLQRSQFDEIQYGAASMKRNAHGAILRPVITAHGHFRVLRLLFPDVKTHLVAHECFLRGAAITAWAELFRYRLASLWFIDEEIDDEACPACWQLLGKINQGWWQNQWQIWGQENNRKMVCLLAGGAQDKGATLNLAASRRFTAWLQQQPAFQQSAQFSAARVTDIISVLASKYNSLLR